MKESRGQLVIGSECPDSVLDDLIEVVTAKLQAGQPVDLDEVTRRIPEHAERLRRLLPALEMLANLGHSSPRELEGIDASRPEPGFARGVLGDFRILREIGRGGMGVVYEAQQVSLDRRVALKILPAAAALDSKQLQRFQLEAHAAACLHHTHIVPVHAVGCDRGVPFYAMQFIEGRNLAELIDDLRRFEGLDPGEPPGPDLGGISTSSLAAELLTGRLSRAVAPTAPAEPDAAKPSLAPSKSFPGGTAAPLVARTEVGNMPASGFSTCKPEYVRSVAQLGLQAALALDHAHTRGILHRDIKPENLLLDEQGQLWVTDFGLAQIQGNPGLTLTGDILGTLRYMSPEQALAKRVVIDGRTDIYSLGVTLYEFLTLRPAIEGRDRQEILRKIAESDPAPPRQLNQAVPRDLDTILQKAMAKEPSGRYATAKELADELERFLEYRPIQARRPSPLDRAGKWMRRHRPLVASAAGSTVVFLVLAVAVLAVSNLRIKEERERADSEKGRAEANLQQAREVVDRMLTRVAKDLARTPRMEKVRRALLVDAMEFYQDFLRQNGTNPKLRFEAALAHSKVAAINADLGRYDLAEEPWRQAITLFEKLTSEFPAVAEYRDNLADCHARIAEVMSRRGQVEEGISERRRALDLREKLASDFPTVTEYRRKLALLHTSMGQIYATAERVQEAEHQFRQGLVHREKLQADFPEVPEDSNGLIAIHYWWGVHLLTTGRLQEAEEKIRKVLAIQERLGVDGPGGDKALLAHMYDSLGKLMAAKRKRAGEGLQQNLDAESEKLFRRSIQLYESLMEDFPDIEEYRRRVGFVHDHLCSALHGMGRFEEAIAAQRRSIAEEETLLSHQGDSRLMLGGGWGYYELGSLLQTTGRAQEAADAFREAKARFEKKAADNPRVPSFPRELAYFLTTCPATQFRDLPRAITLAKQALQHAPLWSESWYTLGLAEYHAGHWAAAIEALEKSATLGWTLDPSVKFFLAIAHKKLGQEEEARSWYDQAARWMDQRGSRDEELLRLRAEVAALLGLPKQARPSTKSAREPVTPD
jgi:serine/threonine protein kinase